MGMYKARMNGIPDLEFRRPRKVHADTPEALCEQCLFTTADIGPSFGPSIQNAETEFRSRLEGVKNNMSNQVTTAERIPDLEFRRIPTTEPNNEETEASTALTQRIYKLRYDAINFEHESTTPHITIPDQQDFVRIQDEPTGKLERLQRTIGIWSAKTIKEAEDSDCIEDEGSTEVVGSEAVTEVRNLTTAEWSALEQEFAINENDSNGQKPPKKRKLAP